MALAGGSGFTPYAVAATLVGGALSIGASGTFNHVLEARRGQADAAHERPPAGDRPRAGVPRARVRGTLTLVSVGLFWTVNPLTAALGLIAVVFYSVVYTLILKPNTVQNTDDRRGRRRAPRPHRLGGGDR